MAASPPRSCWRCPAAPSSWTRRRGAVASPSNCTRSSWRTWGTERFGSALLDLEDPPVATGLAPAQAEGAPGGVLGQEAAAATRDEQVHLLESLVPCHGDLVADHGQAHLLLPEEAHEEQARGRLVHALRPPEGGIQRLGSRRGVAGLHGGHAGTEGLPDLVLRLVGSASQEGQDHRNRSDAFPHGGSP